ncbi:ty3-gypsy retrotransposon protein [Tanacetum coccineum]
MRMDVSRIAVLFVFSPIKLLSTGATNQAADALFRVFEEAKQVTAAFLAFSQPLVGFIGDLRGENETLAELLEIHGKMNNGEVLSGFRRENGLAGHGGIKKTLVGLSDLFFWKGMRKSVEEFIKKCVVCQQTKYSTEAPVVVDRLTKYAHFGALPTSFKSFQQLFHFSGTQLSHSTAYHPQTDGQTEVVNRCLEQYLRAMVSNRPQQALYGRSPLTVVPYPPGSSKVAAVDDLMRERDGLLRQYQGKLVFGVKYRMECKANCKRRDVEFNVGDMVLVKLQPYRQITLAKRLSNKLAKRYYGPYKAFVGDANEIVADFPEELHDGQPVEQPLAICGRRRVLQNGSPAEQILVQWVGGSPDEATWEWLWLGKADSKKLPNAVSIKAFKDNDFCRFQNQGSIFFASGFSRYIPIYPLTSS